MAKRRRKAGVSVELWWNGGESKLPSHRERDYHQPQLPAGGDGGQGFANYPLECWRYTPGP